MLADIPGLIEGAHEGAGLGDRFLGHIERCRVLLHLVDGTGEDAGDDYKTVRAELEAYGQGLDRQAGDRGADEDRRADAGSDQAADRELKSAAKKTPLLLSSASGQGVTEVLRALFKVIDRGARGCRPTRSKRSGLAAVVFPSPLP